MPERMHVESIPPAVSRVHSRRAITVGERVRSDAAALVRLGARVGTVLAIICHLLPPHYRVVCNAIASVCTGGH